MKKIKFVVSHGSTYLQSQLPWKAEVGRLLGAQIAQANLSSMTVTNLKEGKSQKRKLEFISENYKTVLSVELLLLLLNVLDFFSLHNSL